MQKRLSITAPSMRGCSRLGVGCRAREDLMKKMVRLFSALGLSTAIVIGCGERLLYAQNTNDPNAAPNPYRMEEFPVQMPDGRKLGAPIGVEIDQRDGKTLWVYERCGADTCVGSTVDPVMKLDGNGKILANFGGGLVNCACMSAIVQTTASRFSIRTESLSRSGSSLVGQAAFLSTRTIQSMSRIHSPTTKLIQASSREFGSEALRTAKLLRSSR